MGALRKQKGFTLVELLVVLAIIGVLVGLAVAGMRIVQMVNRDTQRKAFISKDLQLVLEAHQDRTNRYPTYTELQVSSGGSCASGETWIRTVVSGQVVEQICSKVNFDLVPQDSCSGFAGKENESGQLHMCYVGQAKGYELMVKLERSNTPYNASNVEV